MKFVLHYSMLSRHFVRKVLGWSGCLFLSAALVTCTGDSAVQGQGAAAKKKADKAAKAGAKEDVPENPLEELDFGAAQMALLDEGATVELDETSDGKERLGDILTRAKEIFRERDSVDRQRRPLAIPRDRLVGEAILLNQGIIQAQQGIVQAQNQLRRLQRLVNNGDNSQTVQNQIQNAENQIGTANRLISDNQDEILARTPEINALNLQIKPLDERLMKLWSELNACRKQWLELRQPQQKYAHGNYEGLKRVIDDWLLLDGLWPDAFCWAALCNYELGNYRMAWEQVEKAAELRQTLQFPKAWAQGEALRGMIAAKLPDRRNKSAGFLQTAGVFVAKDKKTNWETFFLLGRASCENDKLAGKAKSNFDKALKINGDAACVRYWYGRLQTTTTTASIRDVKAGTETLEDLWKHSTKQSWRLAHAMVLAYDAAERNADAKATWELVQSLAPKEAQEQLQTERDAAQEKLKSLTEDETKPKKGKSSEKKAG